MGAWIETAIQSNTTAESDVAPRVGAWIETDNKEVFIDVMKSHPEWVRGLKLGTSPEAMTPPPSHPEWVRGLKHC